MRTVTNRHHVFLKAAYAADLPLVDCEDQIKAGEVYMTWDLSGNWKLWKMTGERVPIPRGRFQDINSALFFGEREK